jgi:hypothetical protein
LWAPDPEDSNAIVPAKKDATDVSGLIALDEYIRAHVGKWWYGSGNVGDEKGRHLEALVTEVLSHTGIVDELKSNVTWMGGAEADLVMRLGSTFAVAEVKKNLSEKRSIEQLGLITRQRLFGTYIRKLLILGGVMPSNNRQVAESVGITVIELDSWQEANSLSGSELKAFQLSPADQSKLQKEVRGALIAEGDAA